mgnify:FL=1|jgi:hypothetical protein
MSLRSVRGSVRVDLREAPRPARPREAAAEIAYRETPVLRLERPHAC